jgi:hypothetical protein
MVSTSAGVVAAVALLLSIGLFRPVAAASVGALALVLSVSAAAGSLPLPLTENGITYLSGGFDREEALAMLAEARSYPLSLVFSAGQRHDPVADVKVAIKDAAGKLLLDTYATGPIMLVRLPAGRYTISALQSSPGAPLQQSVQVAARGEERLDFHWPQS